MSNEVLQVVSNHQIIYLDTSVAMDEHFQRFVESIEMPLLIARKKITVIDLVWAELLKHLDSNDFSKRQLATIAVQTIGMRRNIFEIEEKIEVNDFQKPFADPGLLSRLILNRNRYTQVLLTNDQGLGQDANGLNLQKSCYGKRVSVYRLNRRGIPEAVEYIEDEVKTIVIDKGEVVKTSAKEPVIKTKDASVAEDKKRITNPFAIAGSAAASFACGYLACRFGKNLLNTVCQLL